MIKAIFLSRFHPEKGPIVVHQIPDGSITPHPTSTTPTTSRTLRTTSHTTTTTTRPLFDFPSISSYLIPPQEFCNRLVTICANHCRIISYPVCIVDAEKYNRNEYIFNVAIVLDEGAEFTSFEGVVRKLARMLREAEVGRGLLSREEDDGGGKVYAICQMILEDLNNYCECMTPIDAANTLNMKLFPTYPSPPRLLPHHVPLATTRLSALATPTTWDLTTTRLLPYIDGINSVLDIARLADADLGLVRRAILHLLYYGFVILLDVFTASAVYAPTAEIGVVFEEAGVVEECVRYTSAIGHKESESDAEGQEWKDDGEEMRGSVRAEGYVLKKDDVCRLYASLRHGLTVRAWCMENAELLQGVDVRRFITFGVIKGFLYRVHTYAVAVAEADGNGSGNGIAATTAAAGSVTDTNTATTTASTSAATPTPTQPQSAQGLGVTATASPNTSSATLLTTTSAQNTTTTTTTLPTRPALDLHLRTNSNHQSITALSTPSQLQPHAQPPRPPSPTPTTSTTTAPKPPSTSSSTTTTATPKPVPPADPTTTTNERPITSFLTGMHSFDEICTTLGMDEETVVERMRREVGTGVVLVSR